MVSDVGGEKGPDRDTDRAFPEALLDQRRAHALAFVLGRHFGVREDDLAFRTPSDPPAARSGDTRHQQSERKAG